MLRPKPAASGDDEHPDDRSLDRLADRGPSRVGVDGALRARDVSRPAAAQLAKAQTSVTVRRARPHDG